MKGARKGTKFLTREEILGVDDIETEEVSVPEWGGIVLVRALSGTQRNQWETQFTRFTGKQVEMTAKTEHMRESLVAASVVCCDGITTDVRDLPLLFTETDVEALGKKSAAALERVFKVASRLSGITESDIEDQVKNSDKAAGKGSSSA